MLLLVSNALATTELGGRDRPRAPYLCHVTRRILLQSCIHSSRFVMSPHHSLPRLRFSSIFTFHLSERRLCAALASSGCINPLPPFIPPKIGPPPIADRIVVAVPFSRYTSDFQNIDIFLSVSDDHTPGCSRCDYHWIVSRGVRCFALHGVS